MSRHMFILPIGHNCQKYEILLTTTRHTQNCHNCQNTHKLKEVLTTARKCIDTHCATTTRLAGKCEICNTSQCKYYVSISYEEYRKDGDVWALSRQYLWSVIGFVCQPGYSQLDWTLTSSGEYFCLHSVLNGYWNERRWWSSHTSASCPEVVGMVREFAMAWNLSRLHIMY